MCIPPFFLIHSSVDGYKASFWIWAIVNNAAMITEVQLSPRDLDFVSLGFIATAQPLVCSEVLL